MKNKTSKVKVKPYVRKRGEHRWREYNGVTKCITCLCDDDDAFVGGLECSYKQKPDWQP